MPQKRKGRPKLSLVSDQVRVWSSALAAEFAGWPQVVAKSFFGLTALYRGKQMFAVLPRTRAWGNNNTLAFKIETLPQIFVPNSIATRASAPWACRKRDSSPWNSLQTAICMTPSTGSAMPMTERLSPAEQNSSAQLVIAITAAYTLFERTFELFRFEDYGESFDSNPRFLAPASHGARARYPLRPSAR